MRKGHGTWAVAALMVAALLLAVLPPTGTNTASAQDEGGSPQPPAGTPVIVVPDGGFTVEEASIVAQEDAFGQVLLVIEGRITNDSEDMAYTGVNLFADILAGDTVIGEGFGFLTDACGLGLLPEYRFRPGVTQRFAVTLEIFDTGDIERVEMFVEGRAEEAGPPPEDPQLVGITTVSREEVVTVEWLQDDSGGLRYAVGCDQDVFINRDWRRYDPATGESVEILHPNTAAITPALRTQLGLEDDTLLNRSFLTFPPGERRLVYQDRINTLLTAEPDGSFRRLIWDNLARFSLQGFVFLPDGRFMAYYFGAFGEPVRYFTASLAAQRISASIYDVQTSRIVPGPTPDGARVVIAETFDGVTGYWLRGTFFAELELLFEGKSPGNNYPAPVFVENGEQDRIYIVRDVAPAGAASAGGETETVLQCFDRASGQLNTLTALPLDLDDQHKAWTWLSPDQQTLALAANGVSGGLWLVDLATFGVCGAAPGG